MVKNILLSIIFFIIVHQDLKAQSKTEMGLYNIGLGGLAGGVGAIFNKEPQEKTGRVFLKGLWQGSIGGYIVYESKNILLNIPKHNKLEYAWGAKIVNSIGISIIENASLNKNFYDKWHFYIGFNRFDLETYDRFKFRYKIMPISFVVTLISAYDKKFEFQKSIRTGQIMFSTSNPEFNYRGLTSAKIITLSERAIDDYGTAAHEIVHSFQYNDFNFSNSFVNKSRLELIENSTLFQKLDKFIYLDLQGPTLALLYWMEGSKSDDFYANFFEYEAAIFSDTFRN